MMKEGSKDCDKELPRKVRRSQSQTILHLQVDTPFSKSVSHSPMSFVDDSENEVGSIYDSAAKDWPLKEWPLFSFSRSCSSSDTSKESLFSPTTIGRCRTMSGESGSGSKKSKSPRVSDMCSPSSQASYSQMYSSPLTVVQEEGRESVGGLSSALSKKLLVWNSSDTTSPYESPSGKMEEVLPNFFNPSTCNQQPRRDRSDSYCDEYDAPFSESKSDELGSDLGCVGYLKSGDVKIPQPFSNKSAPGFPLPPTNEMEEEITLQEKKGMQFQPHDCSVFSSLGLSSSSPTLSSSSSASAPPPPSAPAPSHRGEQSRDCYTEATGNAPQDNILIRATSLNFETAGTFSDGTFGAPFPSQPPPLPRGQGQGTHRHSSCDAKLTRNKTEPYYPKAPQTPPQMERCFSQADDYILANNPRGPNSFNTPVAPSTRTTCGQQGNDWGATEPRPEFELEMFENLFRCDMEGPCVVESSSILRGIFSSISSAFGQKGSPSASKK